MEWHRLSRPNVWSCEHNTLRCGRARGSCHRRVLHSSISVCVHQYTHVIVGWVRRGPLNGATPTTRAALGYLERIPMVHQHITDTQSHNPGPRPHNHYRATELCNVAGDAGSTGIGALSLYMYKASHGNEYIPSVNWEQRIHLRFPFSDVDKS